MEEQNSIYKVAVSRYGVNMVNRLLSLDISKDKHYILTICNLFSEYNDFDKVRNTISRYNQIEQYLDSSEAQKYDKYSGDIDIDIAVGTFRMGNNPNALKKCQIFYDEGVCLYNPNSFEEASAIGGRLWHFCANESLFQKVNANGGRVYFVYNALANHTIDYVAAIAKPNGYVDAYSKNGGRLNRQEYAQWKEELGAAYSLLKPSKTNENKQNTNMNKKLIRLTESDLHRIVKESVKKVIKEQVNPIPTYKDGRPMSFADITAVASISAMNPQHYDNLSQELKDMIDSCKAYLKYMKDPQTIDYNLSL